MFIVNINREEDVVMKTALITGASSGIGEQLAFHFAKDHINLILVARSEGKLHALAQHLHSEYHVEVWVIRKDLERIEAVDELYQEIKGLGIQVDFLVNNAGFGLYGSFLETDVEQEMQMVNLNVKTLTYMTKLFVRDMEKRQAGKILNVASIAAFQPGPLMAVYYATKAYVLSFSEALENELRNHGITVTALCPGPTQTDFGNRANLGESKLFQHGVMDVKTVAKLGYEQFISGKRIVIPGFKYRLLVSLIRFFPRRLITDFVRKIQEKRRG